MRTFLFIVAYGGQCFSCQLKHIKTNMSPLVILEMVRRECSKGRVCSSSILNEYRKLLCWTFGLWKFNQRTKSIKFVVMRRNFIFFRLRDERSVLPPWRRSLVHFRQSCQTCILHTLLFIGSSCLPACCDLSLFFMPWPVVIVCGSWIVCLRNIPFPSRSRPFLAFGCVFASFWRTLPLSAAHTCPDSFYVEPEVTLLSVFLSADLKKDEAGHSRRIICPSWVLKVFEPSHSHKSPSCLIKSLFASLLEHNEHKTKSLKEMLVLNNCFLLCSVCRYEIETIH